MLYQNYETEVSWINLTDIISSLSKYQCLLGGWAVYLTVNRLFNQEMHRNYQGSRDIDLGFHIDINTNTIPENSLFLETIRKLELDGFSLITQRYVKRYHTETRQVLDEAKSKTISQPFIFNHYVDPIVDHLHPNIRDICGFNPIDEPLLQRVFQKNQYRWQTLSGVKFMLPNPEILLGCKINSVISRPKEDKRVKDIVDIYALIWYSGISRTRLFSLTSQLIGRRHLTNVLTSFDEEDYERADDALNINRGQISNVIRTFAASS